MKFHDQAEQALLESGAAGSSEDPTGEGLHQARQEGESFLAAANDVIEQTLSGDSEKFVKSTRQRGGQ